MHSRIIFGLVGGIFHNDSDQRQKRLRIARSLVLNTSAKPGGARPCKSHHELLKMSSSDPRGKLLLKSHTLSRKIPKLSKSLEILKDLHKSSKPHLGNIWKSKRIPDVSPNGSYVVLLWHYINKLAKRHYNKHAISMLCNWKSKFAQETRNLLKHTFQNESSTALQLALSQFRKHGFIV